MSKFSSYATRVDKIAQDIFAEYVAAENTLKEAEAVCRKYPQHRGVVDYEYAAKSARAQADLMDAKNKLKQVQERMAAHNSDIAAIRQELAKALKDEYAAKPSDIDPGVLELLKTGVLRSDEYAKLMHDAQEADNVTMSRLISRYAADAAEEISKKYGQRDQKAMELRAVAHQGNSDDVGAKLGMFDAIAETYQRTVNNVGMINYWNELVGPVIESF